MIYYQDLKNHKEIKEGIPYRWSHVNGVYEVLSDNMNIEMVVGGESVRKSFCVSAYSPLQKKS